MRRPLKRLIVAGALLDALASAIWERQPRPCGTSSQTTYIYPYGIREGRTAHYRLSCRSWPTEAVAKQTEAYATVFHRLDSLERSPSYAAVKRNTRELPGQSGP